MSSEKSTRREFLKTLAVTGIALYCLPAVKIDAKTTIPARQKDFFRIGILSDAHGSRKNVEYFIRQMEKQGVQMYIMPGDLSQSFGEYEGSRDDPKEISDVVEPVASTKKTLIIIPGNHEERDAYNSTIAKLSKKYKNIINAEKNPVIEVKEPKLIIAAYGGKDNPNFTVPGGFLRSYDDFMQFARNVKSANPSMLVTHVPRKYNTQNGLDMIANGHNVGADALNEVIRLLKVKFVISGDIHEAYGILGKNERPIKEGELSERLEFNAGAVYDHTGQVSKPSAGILDVFNDKARAYFLR